MTNSLWGAELEIDEMNDKMVIWGHDLISPEIGIMSPDYLELTI